MAQCPHTHIYIYIHTGIRVGPYTLATCLHSNFHFKRKYNTHPNTKGIVRPLYFYFSRAQLHECVLGEWRYSSTQSL